MFIVFPTLNLVDLLENVLESTNILDNEYQCDDQLITL